MTFKGRLGSHFICLGADYTMNKPSRVFRKKEQDRAILADLEFIADLKEGDPKEFCEYIWEVTNSYLYDGRWDLIKMFADEITLVGADPWVAAWDLRFFAMEMPDTKVCKRLVLEAMGLTKREDVSIEDKIDILLSISIANQLIAIADGEQPQEPLYEWKPPYVWFLNTHYNHLVQVKKQEISELDEAEREKISKMIGYGLLHVQGYYGTPAEALLNLGSVNLGDDRWAPNESHRKP